MLPLVVSDPGATPRLFPLPDDAVLEVPAAVGEPDAHLPRYFDPPEPGVRPNFLSRDDDAPPDCPVTLPRSGETSAPVA